MNKTLGVFTCYFKKTEIGITYLANKYISSMKRFFMCSDIPSFKRGITSIGAQNNPSVDRIFVCSQVA